MKKPDGVWVMQARRELQDARAALAAPVTRLLGARAVLVLRVQIALERASHMNALCVASEEQVAAHRLCSKCIRFLDPANTCDADAECEGTGAYLFNGEPQRCGCSPEDT